MILGSSENKPLPINLEKLVEGRLLVQANSGAGKSWALRGAPRRSARSALSPTLPKD